MREYTNSGPIVFEATIESDGTGAHVVFPHDLKATYGAGNLVPVKVTFDDRVVYRGSLAKMRGRVVIGLRKDIQAQLGKQPGETVAVTVELDDAPREVEIPADLAAALQRAGLAERFAAMAYTHRREYAEWVASAKRPQTRARRVGQACERIAVR